MIEAIPVLAAREAIAFFRRKGFRIGFAWQDVWQDEHARAFTVAKAMSRDLLEDIRAAVDEALSEGLTLKQFRDGLRPKLEARGWWGRRNMVDPLTGETKTVQLGSPRRLKTIFQVNMRTAYQAGRYERIQRTKAALPFMRYVSVMDGRERPEHHAWHGTILPIDHPWWQTHYPPCGWNCRCTVQALNQRTIDRRGWKVTDQPVRFPERPYLNKRTGEITSVERGIDPGWSYNVGAAALDGLAPAPLPKGTGTNAAAAELGEVEDLARAFLAPFKLKVGESRIFTDQQGWPLPISSAWFRDAAGKPEVPAGATAEQLARVAETILDADAITWRWIRAEDGSAVLMRRYLRRDDDGPACRVEVGRLGWRFSIGNPEVAGGYNPHQPRDRNGRWRSTHAALSYIENAWANPTHAPPPFVLGKLSVHAVEQIERLDLTARRKDGAPKSVTINHGEIRHILLRHGSDHRLQKPIGPADIQRAMTIINSGHLTHGTPKVSPGGSPRIHVKASVGPHRYSATFEVRKYHVLLTALRKR